MSSRGTPGGATETTGSSTDAGDLDGLADDVAAAALATARHFAAGATMWCCAPAAPADAHHVAVEFVHPVIVGKRALPATVVDGPDWPDRLSLLARAGDVLVVVGPDQDSAIARALRRASAWGLLTLWIGTGRRPAPGAADFVLWLEEDDDPAVLAGRVVLLYHLLWELTHVCFEHPGLLVVPDACDDEVCTTCSDEGRLGEVVGLSDPASAAVRTPDGLETVDISLIDEPPLGALVLIHAGSAVAIVDGDPR